MPTMKGHSGIRVSEASVDTAGPGAAVVAVVTVNDQDPDTTCPSADVTR
jgi:hypothetical protein